MLPTLSLFAGLVSLAAPQPAAAYVRHRNFAQRHPILTGVAAATAAHHYGHKRRVVGRHRNFAERHPILTGAAAAAAAHHVGKHH
jgi:hypothetical protein